MTFEEKAKRALMTAPREVTLELTRRCNLSCPFCYVRLLGDRLEKDDLEVSEWLRFLDELAAARVFMVGFIGGEPLVYRGLPELVERMAALTP